MSNAKVPADVMQKMRDNQPKVVGAIKQVVAEYTGLDEDAIADKNVICWCNELLDEWRRMGKLGQHRVRVNISTGVMFAALRVAVKEGLIENMILSVDGVEHDVVLPNGKIASQDLPQEFMSEYEDLLMKLI